MRVRSLILSAGAVAAVACSGSDNGGQGPGDENPEPEADIVVRNNFFDPANLEVAPGATVVWAWASGGTVHNILFDDGPTSGNQGEGTFQRTFAAAGNFPYHCTIHAGMTGSISVGAAPSPGGGSGGGGGGGGPYDY